MEQRILVGLHIGSGSASAASMLSDKKDRTPTQILWPGRQRATVPLRVQYEDRKLDASFKWGDQVEEASADNLFGISAFMDPFYSGDAEITAYRRLVDHLHAKRGAHYSHLPWSLYSDIGSISDAHLSLFIRSVKQHLVDRLNQMYSEAAMRMNKSVCVVVPPHLSVQQAGKFSQRMRELLSSISSDIVCISQPRAAFMSLEPAEQSRLKRGDYLICCHIEGKISTISVLRSEEGYPAVPVRISGITLDVGSEDILDAFQRYVEYNSFDKITIAFRQDKMSAAEVWFEMLKARNSFADGLRNITSEKPLLVRIAPLGLRLRIRVDYLHTEVFGDVLDEIISHIQHQIDKTPREGDKYVLLSGGLAESDYVHDYVQKSLKGKAVLLESSDEEVAASLGAVLHLVPGATRCDPQVKSWTVDHKHIESAEAVDKSLVEQENEATVHLSTDALEPSNQQLFTRRVGLIFEKRLTFRGINDEATKSTCLSLITLLQRHDCTEAAVSLTQWFARKYTEDRRAALSPSDMRSSLENLHLAASFCDILAIRIMTAGYMSFKMNVYSPLATGIHETHTPLELYTWYCQDDISGVEVLLDLGADEFIPEAARIAARRGHLILLKIYESWSPAYFKRNSAALFYLALIDGHVKAASWLLISWNRHCSPLSSLEIADPFTGETIPHSVIRFIHSAITKVSREPTTEMTSEVDGGETGEAFFHKIIKYVCSITADSILSTEEEESLPQKEFDRDRETVESSSVGIGEDEVYVRKVKSGIVASEIANSVKDAPFSDILDEIHEMVKSERAEVAHQDEVKPEHGEVPHLNAERVEMLEEDIVSGKDTPEDNEMRKAIRKQERQWREDEIVTIHHAMVKPERAEIAHQDGVKSERGEVSHLNAESVEIPEEDVVLKKVTPEDDSELNKREESKRGDGGKKKEQGGGRSSTY